MDRLHDLYSYHIFGTPPEKEIDDFALIAAELCDTPIALVTLLDDEWQCFKANIGLDGDGICSKDSFCQYTINNPEEVLVVEDALHDNRVNNLPLVVEHPHVRFYTGAPLVTPNGNVIGALCVIDDKPRKISDTKKQAMQCLAQKVMDYLNARKLMLLQKENIEYNAAQLKNMTDQAPGFVYQFEMTADKNISFDFVSKGISIIHPALTPEKVKEDPDVVFSVIHPDDLPSVMSGIEESFQQLTEWRVEFRVVDDERPVQWLMGKAMPEKKENGKVVWYGTVQNITNRVEYEHAIEEVALNISHVLRKPVCSLLGLSALLKDGKWEEKQLKQYFKHIHALAIELDEYTVNLNRQFEEKAQILKQSF